ncbi:hypothetical protein K9L67_01695 [Candidatus Woesearchaeota archaeon]|nr:hypothetical protein [Candidatus Woesearchaeota archaeon]
MLGLKSFIFKNKFAFGFFLIYTLFFILLIVSNGLKNDWSCSEGFLWEGGSSFSACIYHPLIFYVLCSPVVLIFGFLIDIIIYFVKKKKKSN